MVAEGFTEKWHDECGAEICDKDWGTRAAVPQIPPSEIHSLPHASPIVVAPPHPHDLHAHKAIAWGMGDFLDFETLWREMPAVTVSVVVLAGLPCFLIGMVVGKMNGGGGNGSRPMTEGSGNRKKKMTRKR